MKLVLAIMDFALVAMNLCLAQENGETKSLNIICAVLWFFCGIVNLITFLARRIQ